MKKIYNSVMKQYIDYQFFQKQIMLMVGLSLIPGLVYLVFGWLYGMFVPALIWYSLMGIVSLRDQRSSIGTLV